MLEISVNLIEQARQYIALDDIKMAFSIINMCSLRHQERDDFLLIENQFNNWDQNKAKGLAPPTSERNRIVFAFLSMLTQMEIELAPTFYKKKQVEIEKTIENYFEKINKLEKPFSKTDEVLCKIAKQNPRRFEQLKSLAADLQKSRGSLDDSDLLIDFWANEILTQKSSQPQDVKIITHLLSNQPNALLQLFNERRHRNSTIHLLETQVTVYKERYEKLKIGGLVGLAGFLIGSWFSRLTDQSTINSSFDENGYDKKGFDAEGFDKLGFNIEGKHFIEGFNKTDFLNENSLYPDIELDFQAD